MSTVLLIDENGDVGHQAQDMLATTDSDILVVQSAAQGLKFIASKEPDALLLDLDHPGGDGIQLLQQLKGDWPQLPVIVISSPSASGMVIETMQCGAFEHLLKPLQPEEFTTILRDAINCRQHSKRAIKLDGVDSVREENALIGTSRCMQEVYKAIGRVAATDASVLISGETGTGKELVAHAIYKHSLRSAKRMVTLNCAAIPENLLESKLFGHEKGSFTGAVSRRIGRFEQADGGTIFLDEIGELPVAVQAKLLRVLQQGTIERVGGNERIKVDVRIIAATNRDLAKETVAGRFREDLFHRLNVMNVRLPPLRERPDDIPKLVNYFYVQLTDSKHLKRSPIIPEAMEELKRYPWPGNVRELQHCISQALILSGGYPVTAEDVREILLQNPTAYGSCHDGPDVDPLDIARYYLSNPSSDDVLKDFLGDMESAMVKAALRQTQGNQSKAAKVLGISRPSVRAKMDKYGIEIEHL